MEAIGNWFKGVGESIVGLGSTIADNVGFVFLFLGVVVAIFVIAIVSEKLICKKHNMNYNDERFKVNKMAIIAMLSVIAIILNLFGFPLWFIMSSYKLDFSELPAIIGGFALGPVAGVTIEGLKILLNLLINGTSTAFVGEFANFIMSCAFVLPASMIYFTAKKRKTAFIGLAVGTVINGVAGALLNAYLLLPVYAKLFFKSDTIAPIIAMGTEKNSAVDSLGTFIMLAVVPFNLLKCALVAIITLLIYKSISRLLKYQNPIEKKN